VRHARPSAARGVAVAALLFAALLRPPGVEARLAAHTIRFEAYVSPAPARARPEATWNVRAGDADVVLVVVRLKILSGVAAPSDVVQALKPYKAATFRITGDEKLIAELAKAPPGSEVEIEGVLRIGPARTFLASKIDVDPPD
jgi:hypothetical protein